MIDDETSEIDHLSWPDTADSECEQYYVFPQYVVSSMEYPQNIFNYPCGLPSSLTSGAVEPNCVFGFANWKRILYGLCLCVDSQTNDIFKSACGYLYGWSAALSRNVEHNFEICTNELLLFFARMLYNELPHGFLVYPHGIQDDAEVLLFTQAGSQCFVQSKENFHRNRPALFFSSSLSLSMLRIWTYDLDLVCLPDVISALNNLCGKRPNRLVVNKVLQFIKRVWGMSTYSHAIRGTNFRKPSTMSMLAAGLHEDLPQGFIGWDQQSMQWPRRYKYDRFPQKLFEYNDRWQDLPTVYFAGDNTVSVFFGFDIEMQKNFQYMSVQKVSLGI